MPSAIHRKRGLKDIVMPIAVIVLALGGILGGTYFVNALPKDTPAARLSLPRKHTVILIDQTDSLSERCVIRVRDMLEHLPERIGPGEMVSVFAVHANSDLTVSPLMSVRNPGRDANEWIENYRLKQEAFNKEFLDPISELAQGIGKRPDSPSSPIVETINRVAGWHMFSSDVPERKMIIFSDMLQNSFNCSDYRHSQVVVASSTGCPDFEPLEGVDVTIDYILRRNKSFLQTKKHRKKWINRFEEAGASVHFENTY